MDFAFDPDSFANHGTNPFFDPYPEEEDEERDPEYNAIMREEQLDRGHERAEMEYVVPREKAPAPAPAPSAPASEPSRERRRSFEPGEDGYDEEFNSESD